MAPPADPYRNSPRTWAMDLAGCAVAGALLGVLGPFGSYLNSGLLARIAYWTGIFVFSGVVLSTALRAAAPVARRFHIPIWAWLPALVLVINGPLCLPSRLAAVAIWPDIAEHVSLLEWFGQSLLIGLIASSVFAAFRLRSPPTTEAGETPPPDTAFLKRLPPKVGRDLVCLQMEDHYVRVHGPEGSILLLIPLRQAVAELEGVEGMQVHRSWWVAHRAVAGVINDGRNLRLRLSNGLEAPVARAQVARLRAAGWIE